MFLNLDNILVSSNLMDNSNIIDSSGNVNLEIINIETPILISGTYWLLH